MLLAYETMGDVGISMECYVTYGPTPTQYGGSHYYENISKKGWAPLLKIVRKGESLKPMA